MTATSYDERLNRAREMRAVHGPESDQYFTALADIPDKEARRAVDAETTTQQGGIVNDWGYKADRHGNHNVYANGRLVARALTETLGSQIAYEHNYIKGLEGDVADREREIEELIKQRNDALKPRTIFLLWTPAYDGGIAPLHAFRDENDAKRACGKSDQYMEIELDPFAFFASVAAEAATTHDTNTTLNLLRDLEQRVQAVHRCRDREQARLLLVAVKGILNREIGERERQ